MRRPPMVAVVGRKNSGKTTLVVRLVAALHARGHRVMTIKHGTHTFNIDPSTTDTYRHFHEGQAERVAMASPDKFALVLRWSDELGPEEIAARFMGEADVVVCEGFKASALPRIEIHRRAVHDAPLYDGASAGASRWLAIVTDDPALEPPIPCIRLEDPAWLDAVVALVEREVIGREPAAPGV